MTKAINISVTQVGNPNFTIVDDQTNSGSDCYDYVIAINVERLGIGEREKVYAALAKINGSVSENKNKKGHTIEAFITIHQAERGSIKSELDIIQVNLNAYFRVSISAATESVTTRATSPHVGKQYPKHAPR